MYVFSQLEQILDEDSNYSISRRLFVLSLHIKIQVEIGWKTTRVFLDFPLQNQGEVESTLAHFMQKYPTPSNVIYEQTKHSSKRH